ncbi:hypothetical protein BIFGAL_03674 [Bifidobacterium gallicum DSM 20093 = LMG 11596]|uniref:Uncharacterized protein n=1 Tax=Bifidobacterium gallicum DSM 20093 = LMG 11596 TaxID=561180 RepID=D1NUZ6_9BIFI|nr:hypothetical protein BIFGAL_03674 [Bifidobacterium gallicum DSM 20093 = LMG 11596]KFI59614.1 hypothetical protein BGLCM_0282 [Bifidobacterium gallicum DSM 20093 = LMG 11596]
MFTIDGAFNIIGLRVELGLSINWILVRASVRFWAALLYCDTLTGYWPALM